MKAQVMKQAWEIFKKGDRTMAAWSKALRTAWEMVKGEENKPQYVTFDVNHQPSGGKEWVAEIVGIHPKYKFERRFDNPVAHKWSSSGKTGKTTFALEVGKVYEVNEPWTGRYFVEATIKGEVLEISAKEVLAKIA